MVNPVNVAFVEIVTKAPLSVIFEFVSELAVLNLGMVLIVPVPVRIPAAEAVVQEIPVPDGWWDDF